MAKQFTGLEAAHQEFIARQKIFFVASATASSHVNLSPRGTDLFRIIDANSVLYLDKTGSGNETAAHIRAGGRMTIMFCAFEGPPQILRLYGSGVVHSRRSYDFAVFLRDRFDSVAPPGARQIVELSVELVQTSCGYGVPRFIYRGERDGLDRWAEQKSDADLEAYWREKNIRSLDVLPTGIEDLIQET
jgi:Pyridoxamine 5'-phosphate oxidase